MESLRPPYCLCHPRKESIMTLAFALLILFVSMLALVPIILDDELRQNLKFWSLVVVALSIPWLIIEFIK